MDLGGKVLKVMSFNVSGSNPKDKGDKIWESRKDVVINLIKTYSPHIWEGLKPEAVYEKIGEKIKISNMLERYDSLSKSIRKPEHPLAKDWPKKFEGSYEDFINFSKCLDTRERLEKKKMVIISNGRLL